jgi:hypothetical protein
MTQRLFNETLVRGLFVALCLAAMATGLWAQSAQDSAQGITAGSADVAGNVGFSNLTGADGNKHVHFGGSGGINLSPRVTLLGEYSYMPMGSLSGVAFNTQLIGVVSRLNFFTSKRAVPYALVGAGFDRLNGSESGVNVSANGSYAAVGGGASLYLGKSWGIRPEFRYERQEVTFAGLIADTNVVMGTASVFFQWGGRGTKSTPQR